MSLKGLGSLVGKAARVAKGHPVAAAASVGSLGAGAALAFGAPIVESARQEFTGAQGGLGFDRLVSLYRQEQAHREAQELKLERLRRAMEMNAARLAQVAPELYQQILAGRPLPRSSRWIGGAPRQDLLQQVALEMARGEYGPSPMETGEPDPLAQLVM